MSNAGLDNWKRNTRAPTAQISCTACQRTVDIPQSNRTPALGEWFKCGCGCSTFHLMTAFEGSQDAAP